MADKRLHQADAPLLFRRAEAGAKKSSKTSLV